MKVVRVNVVDVSRDHLRHSGDTSQSISELLLLLPSLSLPHGMEDRKDTKGLDTKGVRVAAI